MDQFVVPPEQVRLLVVSDVDEVPTLSELFHLPVEFSQQLREQWIRRLTGRCVLCGNNSERIAHDFCKGEVLDRRPTLRWLGELHPEKTVLWKSCDHCHKKFEMTVRVVAKAIKKGYLAEMVLCERCKTRRFCKPLTFRPFAELAKAGGLSTGENENGRGS